MTNIMKTIDEHIASEMQDSVSRRGNSPLSPIVFFAAGVVALCVAYSAHLDDSLQTALLSIGFIIAVFGLIWAILCFSKILWHYYYIPSKCKMKRQVIYLSADDFRRCSDALNANDISALAALHPVVSSNGELQTLVAADKSFALLQLGRQESSSFEPASPVVALKGYDVSLIPLHI